MRGSTMRGPTAGGSPAGGSATTGPAVHHSPHVGRGRADVPVVVGRLVDAAGPVILGAVDPDVEMAAVRATPRVRRRGGADPLQKLLRRASLLAGPEHATPDVGRDHQVLHGRPRVRHQLHGQRPVARRVEAVAMPLEAAAAAPPQVHEALDLGRVPLLVHEIEADVGVAPAAVRAMGREVPAALAREIPHHQRRAGARFGDAGGSALDQLNQLRRAIARVALVADPQHLGGGQPRRLPQPPPVGHAHRAARGGLGLRRSAARRRAGEDLSALGARLRRALRRGADRSEHEGRDRRTTRESTSTAALVRAHRVECPPSAGR